EAISSRMLESSVDGATRVLLSIAGNKDLGIQEINDAADLVAKNVDPDANIIFGTVVDESLGDQVRVTVIATGFRDDNVSVSTPSITNDRRSTSSRQDRRGGRSNASSRGGASDAFDIPDFLKRSTRM
ncbi:MAG: cell division protein FtsZ, partial [Coriobacteriales bacterium]|nr:cell division protein FtsZ [Coriobacteriales bacterium]